MNQMGVAIDFPHIRSTSVWRYSIEKLTADCVLRLPHNKYAVLDTLGIVANIGNSPTFEYY